MRPKSDARKCAILHQIMHSPTAMHGVPMENAFIVLDDAGMQCGSATVTEFTNDSILSERPLNFYLDIDAKTDRAFDMLIGALMARALYLRRRNPGMAARIYAPCAPNDLQLMRDLQSFGFENDDGEIRMRKILSPEDKLAQPPVGCTIEPVLLEDEADGKGLLQRLTAQSVTAKTMNWLARLQNEQIFLVLGVWQDGTKLLGELVLTAYGTEGHIEMVYTRPEYRGRGIATALVTHAAEFLQQNGVRSMFAEVWRRNTKAMSFFQKLNFDSVSPVILYPGIDL